MAHGMDLWTQPSRTTPCTPDARFLQEMRAAQERPDPLFVVTAPRSGSTLLVQLLGAHPAIGMTNEAACVTFLRKSFLLASTPSSSTIDDGEGFETPGIVPERYAADLAASYLSVWDDFMETFYRRVAYGNAPTLRYFGDKLLSPNDLEFAVRHFPGARFLQLIRDPRDILASSYAFERAQPVSWSGAPFTARVSHLRQFLEKTHSLLEGRTALRVRYESLVSDLSGALSEVLAFLALDLELEVAAFLNDEAPALFERHGTSQTPARSIGRWKGVFTADEQRAISDGLGPWLERLGYIAPQHLPRG